MTFADPTLADPTFADPTFADPDNCRYDTCRSDICRSDFCRLDPFRSLFTLPIHRGVFAAEEKSWDAHLIDDRNRIMLRAQRPLTRREAHAAKPRAKRGEFFSTLNILNPRKKRISGKKLVPFDSARRDELVWVLYQNLSTGILYYIL